MGMSKNENEARIYTGGRESARIFLRASSSHYTIIIICIDYRPVRRSIQDI